MSLIFEQTCNLLKSGYKKRLEELVVSDVRIGRYLTAVRLSDNSIGTAATLSDDVPFCPKSNRDFGDFSPLKIKGQKALHLLETQKESGIISSLKTAALNAISSKIISSGKYKILENCDPIELLNLNFRKTITIVGAFQSYIRRISETDNKLNVLELSENALTPDQRKFFVPASEYEKIIPSSDIVIVTGQALVNRTIDELLAVVSPRKEVIVTGPSSGLLPDILFENKVTIIGTVRITKPEILFDIISEGGTGYHLFEYCAQKICILKNDELQTE